MITNIFGGLFVLVLCELLFRLIINYLRSHFQWLITEKDDYPCFDMAAFQGFLSNSFDKELGWIRRPNTSGIEKGKFGETKFHIDNEGSRNNLVNFSTSIVSFGDSYTFCRQVDDNQTWQAYLSNRLEDKVLNFGVGNYGVDQSLLYYKNHSLPDTTKVVILGFVPETICRIQSYWKHYLEFGNIFAFKPRFSLSYNKLQLHPNLISGSHSLENLQEIIETARLNDRFYKQKFKRLQFRFPYIFWYFVNFRRNSSLIYLLLKRQIYSILNIKNTEVENAPFAKIMEENILNSHKMYSDKYACDLLEAILVSFASIAKQRGHKPLLLVMPQMIDMKIIKRNKNSPYEDFFKRLSKHVHILDMTQHLQATDLGSLYTDDLYGGHFSSEGNKLVADKLLQYFELKAFLNKD